MFKRRSRKGSAISDFGPALFIMFIVILFPLMDLLGLTLSYGICWYLNFKICNEVARAKKLDAPAIAQSEVDRMKASGFANFLKVQNISTPTPLFQDNAIPPTVTVTTSITVMPFVPVPWFVKTPGLNDAVTFSISSVQNREITL